MGLIQESNIEKSGDETSIETGKKIVQHLKENASEELQEFFGVRDLQEDNTMSNSGALYTTKLANFIYYKSYDRFKKYYDFIWTVSPQELGDVDGAGAYKIPKIEAATAVKLSSGEPVDYINDNKSEVTLETETYGIGTRINRRLLKRGASSFVAKLMTSASEAVQRAVAQDIVNGMVNGADSNNTVSGGISVDAIADAKYYLHQATNPQGVLFGFEPDFLVLSSAGRNALVKSTNFQTFLQYGQGNVPGGTLELSYAVYDGMYVVTAELITATKGGNTVHGMVVDSKHYLAFLKEQGMDTYDGRIQGTAGDQEIIHAMDAGFVIMNAEACAVITA